jgi:inner membrane protein
VADGATSSLPAPRSPGHKFIVTVLLGLLLSIPIFSIYLLIYDRQSQSETARSSIVAGWGQPQEIAGPFLAIPFSQTVETVDNSSGQAVHRFDRRDRTLFIAATSTGFDARLATEKRKRSIYEAVVYNATVRLTGTLVMPELKSLGIDPASLRMNEAEIRVGVSDAKGLAGSPPVMRIDGQAIPLVPGSSLSQTANSGFTGRPATALAEGQRLAFDIAFHVRGNGMVTLIPSAQDTRWQISSNWPSPSFQGGFLPDSRQVGADGFRASGRVGNLALNRPTVSIDEQSVDSGDKISVALLDPVDLYDEVTRATKYGFMFVGFTFVALLMFDLIGGTSIGGPSYLLVGAGLVLFFVLLLALAEVIGFTPAYALASLAIVALVSGYSAAVLRSWRRGGVMAALLIGLYAILYILLSLEAYSLLIGSLMMFVALAAVMYFTRDIEWRRVGSPAAAAKATTS